MTIASKAERNGQSIGDVEDNPGSGGAGGYSSEQIGVIPTPPGEVETTENEAQDIQTDSVIDTPADADDNTYYCGDCRFVINHGELVCGGCDGYLDWRGIN